MRRKLLFAVVLAWALYLAIGAWQTVKAEPNLWLPSTVGLHIASAHSQPGYNNDNPGVSLRWQQGPLSGLTLGYLRNSLSQSSSYIAYTASTERYSTRVGTYSAAISLGLINGYRQDKRTTSRSVVTRDGQPAATGQEAACLASGSCLVHTRIDWVDAPDTSYLVAPSIAWHATPSAALRLSWLPNKSQTVGAHALHLSAEWSF